MNKIIINSFLVIGFSALFFASCKKQDTMESSPAKLYILDNLNYPLVNEYNFGITTKVGIDGAVLGRIVSGDSVFSFPIKINVPVKEAVTAKVELDAAYTPEKIRSIDTLLSLISPQNFEIRKGSVTIPAGAYQSTDSVVVALKDFASLLAGKKSGAKGILPLKIAAQSTGVVPSTNLSTLKIMGLYKFDTTNINMFKTEAPATLLDRTNPRWTVEVSSVFPSEDPFHGGSNMLDGNRRTAWFSSYETTGYALATLDMQQINNINGIQIFPNYLSIDNNSSVIEVLISEDKIKWVSHGTYTYTGPILTNGNFDNPDIIRNIYFYTPVKARYIRLKLFTGSGYTGIGELNVF